ncbi:CHASE2 domain-containing protein [Thermomonas flagellata]|uniref:CHASE2 domain-containing protein n=1 Tax=Thermomonas flagellata TaxID=2888524 RepID=UPI001F04D1BE|nr:CHASE2 domain-containing protein [Thermomonas flagellata]
MPTAARSPALHPWLLALGAGCVLLLALTGLTRPLDGWLYDRLSGLRAPAADRKIVVVEIDQHSLDALGAWPWPRALHARLLQRLQQAQPAAIGFDVLFAEPDRHDPAGDAALAAAMRASGRVALAVTAEAPQPGAAPLETLPAPPLAAAAAAFGHTAITPDPDGVARSAYLQAGVGDARWPALGAALVALAGPAPAAPLGERRPPQEASPYRWEQDRRVLLPNLDLTGLRRVSYLDLLQGQVPAGLLRGALVLVGATAEGLGEEVLVETRDGRRYVPGTLFQAGLASELLARATVTPLTPAQWLPSAAALALLPLLLLWRFPRLPAWAVLTAGALLTLAVSAWLLLQARLWLPPVSPLLALALAGAVLALVHYRRAHRLALTDGLTRVGNRRQFDAALAREHASALRTGHPLALLLIDIDHFKRYNDRLGHRAGDEALRRVSQLLAAQLRRPRDLCARYGGDELAAVLPETDGPAALALAERLRAAVRAQRIPHPDNEERGILTLSIGIAVSDPQDASVHALLDRADVALYLAKSDGRDRARLAPPPGA